MNTKNLGIGAIKDEFEFKFGDPRTTRRLVRSVEQIERRPSESFPKLFAEKSEAVGFYRFLRNPTVSWKNIFEGHRQATIKRARLISMRLL